MANKLRVFRSLPGQAAWVWQHPLNTRDRINSELRWLTWAIYGRLFGGRTYRWVNNTKFRAEPGDHGITRCISGRLEEPQEMAFALHFLRDGDLFVDIGANVGAYSLLAHTVGAKAIAFEPHPKTFSSLLRNFEANNAEIEAYKAALSDIEGEGFLTEDLGARNHLSKTGIPVSIRTLDSILGSRQASLVKLDVEGAETRVINGGFESFSKCEAVIVEMLGHGKRFGDGDFKVHNLLDSHGLHPFQYDPFCRVLTPLEGPNKESVNTIYVRDSKSVQKTVKAAPQFNVMGRII